MVGASHEQFTACSQMKQRQASWKGYALQEEKSMIFLFGSPNLVNMHVHYFLDSHLNICFH